MVQLGDKVGKYTIIRKIGEGGFGRIWEGVKRDEHGFEHRVAIKIIYSEMLDYKEGRELFLREATNAGSLRHPNIAAVLDFDHDKGYIVYELISGIDLSVLLRSVPLHRLSSQLSVYISSQLCRALSYAHQRRLHGVLSPVVHRDISPGNILCDYDGNVVVVDFGISKNIASSVRSETVKGKLAYMAPEQATGKDIDGRTDQYAVGVVAYEMVSGVRPNDGQHDGETLNNALTGNHIPIDERVPEIPAGLSIVIERMLQVNPDDRFPSMDAVLDALTPFTPPINVHRDLAQLVYQSMPRQTVIVNEGRFVSCQVNNGIGPSQDQGPAMDSSPSQHEAVGTSSVLQSASGPKVQHEAAGAYVYQNQPSVEGSVPLVPTNILPSNERILETPTGQNRTITPLIAETNVSRTLFYYLLKDSGYRLLFGASLAIILLLGGFFFVWEFIAGSNQSSNSAAPTPNSVPPPSRAHIQNPSSNSPLPPPIIFKTTNTERPEPSGPKDSKATTENENTKAKDKNKRDNLVTPSVPRKSPYDLSNRNSTNKTRHIKKRTSKKISNINSPNAQEKPVREEKVQASPTIVQPNKNRFRSGELHENEF